MDNFKGPEPVGCWESFIKGISSIWSTSDLLTGEETEERVRTVTRELGIYMVFLGILCWGKLQLNIYETALNSIQLNQNLTSDCLLI